MKIHRFYIPEEKTNKSSLSIATTISIHFPGLVHQIKNVLRLKIGERLIFFNGNGKEYISSVLGSEGKEAVNLKIEETEENMVSFKKEIYLFVSLIKRNNIELIMEKGTEIGVSHFIPIISARSEKKNLNIERIERILIESAEQCGRADIPKIYPVMKLEKIFKEFDLPFIVFEKDPENRAEKESNIDRQKECVTAFVKKNKILDKKIGILIGPEGGWTPEEIELFKNRRIVFHSLGETTLRAETAAIVASAKLLV